ncbi:MAG: hypothetical protein HQ463_06915 [Bacteroidetes bacterium]|nr:hypothetical protein [Bacteroidota bacterium]
MKQKIYLILSLVSISCSVIIFACKEKSTDPPATATTPVATDSCKNITYTNSISAIVNANCTNSCHIPSNKSGNLLLDSKSAVENAIKNNNLIGRIKGTSGNVMPPAGQMKDSTTKKFDCWKSKSYPN